MASVTSTSISSWASSRSPSRRNCGSLPCSSLRSRSKSAILKFVIVVVLPSVDSATHLEPHGGPFCQRAPEFTPLLATQLADEESLPGFPLAGDQQLASGLLFNALRHDVQPQAVAEFDHGPH